MEPPRRNRPVPAPVEPASLDPARRCARALQRQMQQQICRASAAAWKGVPSGALLRPERNGAAIVQARHTAIYLAHVVFGCSLTRAGAMVGRDRTSARHACLRIEERREHPPVDRALDALEAGIRLWFRTFGTGEAS
ncbi:MAG: hypothetical protein O9308_17165 [Beijerinckiaceae bacterium]|nr:hypothetical protein [Beijerinckiaceae bacterium]